MASRKAGRVAIRDWGGTGTPVLLTHGMAGNTHWWDSVAPRWAGVLRAAALDFGGHGDSDWAADGAYDIPGWIQDVETARAALGWERFLLCGHSMGARVALAYAGLHPGRLRGVAAVDFLPEMRPDRASRFARARSRPQPFYARKEDAVSRFRLEPDGTALDAAALRALGDLSVRRMDAGWTWKFDWRCLGARAAPVWPELPLLRMPALIVRGGESEIFGREDFARVVRELPGARGVEIAGAHHHVPLDRPEELAAAVAEFAALLS